MRGFSVALGVYVWVLAGVAQAATILTQTRFVEAFVDVPGVPERGDMQVISAPDAGPFSATAMAAYALGGGVSAAQQSTLSDDRVQVSGGVAVSNEFFQPDLVEYRGRSSLEVAFELGADEPFSVVGVFGGVWDVAGFNVDAGLFEASLTGPGGVVFAEAIASPAPNPSGNHDPPVEFAHAGVLPAGEYLLHVRLTDALLAAPSEIGGGGAGWFSVDLRIPEPVGLVVALAGAPLMRRRG